MGTMKPAPADKVISFIFMVKPVGAPFTEGSPERDMEFLAMQIGRFLKPYGKFHRLNKIFKL